MFRLAWFFPVLLLCLVFASVGYTDEKQPADNKRGSIIDGNTYNNPALAMTIKLPGTWHFLEKPVSEQPNDPSCQGPLCGTPEVNVALEFIEQLDLHADRIGILKPKRFAVRNRKHEVGESTQLVYNRLHNAISTARVCRVRKGSGYG